MFHSRKFLIRLKIRRTDLQHERLQISFLHTGSELELPEKRENQGGNDHSSENHSKSTNYYYYYYYTLNYTSLMPNIPSELSQHRTLAGGS